MYSRVTLLEIDTLRVTIDDAAQLFRDEVLPRMRELEGYEGVVVLATPEGKGMLLSLWESEEAAEASSTFATGELERFVTLFRSPPGREGYDVVLAETPGVTVD